MICWIIATPEHPINRDLQLPWNTGNHWMYGSNTTIAWDICGFPNCLWREPRNRANWSWSSKSVRLLSVAISPSQNWFDPNKNHGEYEYVSMTRTPWSGYDESSDPFCHPGGAEDTALSRRHASGATNSAVSRALPLVVGVAGLSFSRRRLALDWHWMSIFGDTRPGKHTKSYWKWP